MKNEREEFEAKVQKFRQEINDFQKLLLSEVEQQEKKKIQFKKERKNNDEFYHDMKKHEKTNNYKKGQLNQNEENQKANNLYSSDSSYSLDFEKDKEQSELEEPSGEYSDDYIQIKSLSKKAHLLLSSHNSSDSNNCTIQSPMKEHSQSPIPKVQNDAINTSIDLNYLSDSQNS